MGALFSQEEENIFKFEIQDTGKKLEGREDVEPEIAKLLEQHENLTEVTLSGNSYGVEACAAIGDTLKGCGNLEIANFGDLFTGRLREEVVNSMTRISSGLMQCSKLQVLSLRDNAFGPDGVNSFSELLENCVSLKELEVTNCGLGPRGGELIANSLMKCENLKLEVFSAGRDRLEDPGITALSSAFQKMRSLRKISVPQNGIKTQGIVALFNSLANNELMQMIDVNDNVVNEEEAHSAVAACVQKLNYLCSLNLGDTLLGDEGATAVLESLLGTNPHIRQLTLSYNDLEDSQILDRVSELLKERSDLEFVDLKGNEFASGSINKLSEIASDLDREVELLLQSDDEED